MDQLQELVAGQGDEVLFARNNGAGKCVHDIHVWLTEEQMDALRRAATAEGATMSEYVRDMVSFRFLGKTHFELLRESRKAALQGTGTTACHDRPSLEVIAS
jgi:hypothetical protein